MGGFFGVVSKEDCVTDLFFGTDYHSHLGTMRGGMAVFSGKGFQRSIHDISNSQFRSKFDNEFKRFEGQAGIGVISDNEDQPLIISSHLGVYAIATVGIVTNLKPLVKELYATHAAQFSEMSRGGINPTELIATLINSQATLAEGVRYAQQKIEGSCSLLILTLKGNCMRHAIDSGAHRSSLVRKWGRWPLPWSRVASPTWDIPSPVSLDPAKWFCVHPMGWKPCCQRGSRWRSVHSCGSTLAIRRQPTKGGTWRWRATAAAARWRAVILSRPTPWAVCRTQVWRMPWGMRSRRASAIRGRL